MNEHSKATPQQITAEYARTAGARYLADESAPDLSLSWRAAANAWVDSHHPMALPGEDEMQFTERLSAIADAYIEGIKSHLLTALGGRHMRPEDDLIEIATTLRRAADDMCDAATQFELLGDVLQLLVEEARPLLGTTSAALLAAKVSIWNSRQSAREFAATHETLSMEADRYAR